MKGKWIHNFVDELDINSSIYYVILLFLGIAIFSTMYVNKKLKAEKELSCITGRENAQNDTSIFFIHEAQGSKM